MKYQKGFNILLFKKIKELILICFSFMISFQFIYCQDVKDLGDLQLNGKIKSVIIKEHLAEIKLGDVEPTEILSKYIYQFYENGKIKSINFILDNTDNAEITQNYNEAGYLISTYAIRQYTGTIIIDSIVYNSSNHIEKRIITQVQENTLNENNKIVGIFYYYYNKNGDLISIKNKFLETISDPIAFSCLNCKEISRLNLYVLQSYTSKEIDKIDGIWDESTNSPKTDGERKVLNNWTKKYESATQYSQDVDIKYFYDERNNWIKSVVFCGSEASPYLIKTREITYY